MSHSRHVAVAWSFVLEGRGVLRLDRRALLTVLTAWCVGCSPSLLAPSRPSVPVATPVAATPAPPTLEPRPPPRVVPPAVKPRIAIPAPIPALASGATATAIPHSTAAALPTEIATPTPELSPSVVAVFPTATPAVALSGRSARVITRGPTSDKVVALTYDAGADRGQAAQLLASLDQAGVKATFGMTGRWAENNPDLVRHIAASGHELMNHTYDHRSFTGKSARPAVTSPQARLTEIQHAEAIIQEISGLSPRPLFRPPYGDEDTSVLQAVSAAGYEYSVLWTVDSSGWRGIPIQQIVDRCLRDVAPGVIYVLHVGGISHDVEATPAIVEGLRARGYRLTTVGALLGLPSTAPPVVQTVANGG
jgi:peptidoglycan-N-acetylglucosamine deacetylase